MIHYLIPVVVLFAGVILYFFAKSSAVRKRPVFLPVAILFVMLLISFGTWYTLDTMSESRAPGEDSTALASQSAIESAARENTGKAVAGEAVSIFRKGEDSTKENFKENRDAVERFKALSQP